MYHLPRCIIAGLSGGSGKTLVSLGLTRALSSVNHLKTFKKGPDYIDAAWLSMAAGTPPGNLDPFFSAPSELHQLLYQETIGYDFCLIEGNRGLFDGLDAQGSCSTAQLGRILKTPIILVVGCTKMTRTVAALVAGCVSFEKDTPLAGIILNKIGSQRQRNLIEQCIQDTCALPVLGALPRTNAEFLEENRSGLIRPVNRPETTRQLDALANFIKDHIDISSIEVIAHKAAPLQFPTVTNTQLTIITTLDQEFSNTAQAQNDIHQSSVGSLVRFPAKSAQSSQPMIGIVRDATFWFYYQENLDALVAAGAQLCEISLLDSKPCPPLDGLYIGGGPPACNWKSLSASRSKLEMLRQMHTDEKPIFTEGTGLLCLLEEIDTGNDTWPMAGIVPASAKIQPFPHAIGYTKCGLTPSGKNFTTQAAVRGHQFLYFQCHWNISQSPENFLFHLTRGKGIARLNSQFYDGFFTKQTLGCGMHLYAPAFPAWADWFVQQSLLHKKIKIKKPSY